MLDLAGLRKACQDTMKRTPSIAAAAGDHVLDSTFIASQLPPLEKSNPRFPNLTRGPIEVHNNDAYALARSLKHAGARGKIGVLNLASDREPAGGWVYTLCKTQEEALCYSSTLYATLRPEYYPFPNTGPGSCAGILSPNVVVFKDTLDNDLKDLPVDQWHQVVVITVAAPMLPKLAEDGIEFADESVLQDLREKIRLSLRMAAHNGVTGLVLGSMGCGAYGCHPKCVAREMAAIIKEEEFNGWFDCIAFAVYAGGPSGQRNFDIFRQVFAQTS